VDERIGLIEVVLQLKTKLMIMLLVFVVAMMIFGFSVVFKSEVRNYHSFFEIGLRDLDVPIERPALVLEKLQVIYLPEVLSTYKDVSVTVSSGRGSSLIRLSTRSPVDNEEQVRFVHRQVLERLQVGHSVRLIKLENAYTSQREVLVQLLAAGQGELSDLKRAEHERVLVRLDRQLANLVPSKIHVLAEPAVGRINLGKGSALAAAAVFSVLLSLLAGGLALFIQALRTRAI